jgi:hypothetical protein
MILSAGPAVAATVAGVQAPASGAAAPAKVKYYIVPPAARGSVPTLYGIAAATLGNGSLFMEIFNLNKGRLQPNGQRLENPQSVEAGWILLLPRGASGPGVHDGPLPTTAKATSRPAHRTAPRSQARAAAGPQAASAGHGSGTAAEASIGVALLVFAVAGLGLVLRRRRLTGAGNQRPLTHAGAPAPGSDWVRGLAADTPGSAPAPEGAAPGAGGPDWPYPDHPSWPADNPGGALTPDHPSWPASDIGGPLADDDHPSWPGHRPRRWPGHPGRAAGAPGGAARPRGRPTTAGTAGARPGPRSAP